MKIQNRNFDFCVIYRSQRRRRRRDARKVGLFIKQKGHFSQHYS